MRIRSEKKRNEIIRIAGALFLAHGYGAVSMATIAAAVGGSKGTLYGYFPSKEELFAAFVVNAGQQRRDEFMALPDKPANIDEKLRNLGRNYLRFLVSEEIMSVNRLVIAEAGRFPELGRIFYENGPLTVINVIVATIEGATRAGELSIEDPVAAAWLFKALCEARLVEQNMWSILDQTSDAEISRNIDMACRIFLNSFHA